MSADRSRPRTFLEECELEIGSLKESLDCGAAAFGVIIEGRARKASEAIDACLEGFPLIELLRSVAHGDDLSSPKRTFRLDDRAEALTFDLATLEWTSGGAAGRSVVSAITAFTGHSEEDVAARTCELFGRGIFQYLSDERLWLEERLPGGPEQRG